MSRFHALSAGNIGQPASVGPVSGVGGGGSPASGGGADGGGSAGGEPASTDDVVGGVGATGPPHASKASNEAIGTIRRIPIRCPGSGSYALNRAVSFLPKSHAPNTPSS